ncbi:MAG TPA: 50S ribosomal protein L11 methyltransferase [Vicinamibacterales bacterium]|jgi:ribosomal protein L11 methyltransferase|nr:50S ribosomal protein L11 methyltransferase [Vicinamibacterales bacterium]
MGTFPAVDVRSESPDIIAACVDDFEPTAIEERADSVRVFFTDARLRDAAAAALSATGYDVQSTEVDDEDWARRSQQNLTAVTVGRIIVSPPWAVAGEGTGPLASSHITAHAGLQPIWVVIEPSMGFGTGHHASTRLCLRALQVCDLTNEFVLDIGTGSGVLAIAAVRLGAAKALGIDRDQDAIQAATANLRHNPEIQSVEFRAADFVNDRFPRAAVVTANLTGALLIREANLLRDFVQPTGRLILSGLLEGERNDVVEAFGVGLSASSAGSPSIVWEEHEDGWVGLGLCCN